jgi:hypothetical protein
MDAESLRATKYVSEVQNISSNGNKTEQVHTSALDIEGKLLIHSTKTNSESQTN